MTPNQIAWMLLADPTFAKNAGAMDWLKQKAAPLALAGGMGLAGGLAGGKMTQQPAATPAQAPETQQVQQQPADRLERIRAEGEAMNMRHPGILAQIGANRASDNASRTLQMAQEAVTGGPSDELTASGWFPKHQPGVAGQVQQSVQDTVGQAQEAAQQAIDGSNRLQPGEAMHPMTQPSGEKYPTLAGIPNRVNDFLSGLGEAGSRMAAIPGDVGQALRGGERVPSGHSSSWPYRREAGPMQAAPSSSEEGSSRAEQRKNEANLEMIAAARHRAEAEARKTEAAMPTGPEGS